MKNLLGTLAAVVALAVAGCDAGLTGSPAPLDRFTYPVGVAYHDGRLLVVSSNFDLAFAGADGGSVLSVDPASSPPAFGPEGVRIGSFGGEIAILRRPDQPGAGPSTTDCGLPSETPAFALVPSRLEDVIYTLGVSPDGLKCAGDCATPVGTGPVSDPYGVSFTCPPGGPARAWVGFLRSPSSESWIGTWELAKPIATMTMIQVPTTTGTGTPRSFAYDEFEDRLYFTSTSSGTVASLRWIDLGGGCVPGADGLSGGCPFGLVNLTSLVSGAELTGLALGTRVPGQPRRLYVAARLYDAQLASTIGARPAIDVGGLLLVLDVSQSPTGGPRLQLVDMLDIGAGAAEVRVLPRAGRPDLVAVTASEDGLLWIYDDEDGVMKRLFSRDAVSGAPLLGEQPFGLAVGDTVDGTTRLYVASFLDAFVTPIDVPLAAPRTAAIVLDGAGAPRRIGQEHP